MKVGLCVLIRSRTYAASVTAMKVSVFNMDDGGDGGGDGGDGDGGAAVAHNTGKYICL